MHCLASWDGQARNQVQWGRYDRTRKSVPWLPGPGWDRVVLFSDDPPPQLLRHLVQTSRRAKSEVFPELSL